MNNIFHVLRLFAIALFLTGASATAMAAGYSAQAGKIYDASGQEIQIRGISHFGFNTAILQPQHLWNMGWKQQIAQIKSLGFNAIRLPFAPDVIRSTTPVDQLAYVDPVLNADLLGKTPLQVLDEWMKEANRQGIYVMLDFHSVSTRTQYPTWFVSNPADFHYVDGNRAYTPDDWRRDLTFMAARYANLPYFFAMDIYNEPHDENAAPRNAVVRWRSEDPAMTNPAYFWKDAAESAATAVLVANPNLLIFVQGVNGQHAGNTQPGQTPVPTNWGEDFRPQASFPLNIPADKLVLSPHTYGPDVYQKTSFSAPSFPANLTADWDALFGRFSPAQTVVIGEWGGNYGRGGGGQSDVTWQNAFADYLQSKGIRNSFYWCYTPNSSDTGGILDDTLNVREDKMTLLRRYWGAASPPPPPPASLTVFGDAMAAQWHISPWSANAAIQNLFAKAGSAIKVDATTWGGINLDSRDANWQWFDQPGDRYTHVRFDVSAGSTVGAGMGSIEVSLDLGWGLSTTLSDYVPSFAPNTWYSVEMPLSVMNPNKVNFRRLQFQNNTQSNLTFYIDNVTLVGSGGGGPVTPPPPPPPGKCASVMPLGDSITLGVNGGYRDDLYTGLAQDNCGVNYVGTQSDQYTNVADKDHEGHSGFTIGDIAREVNPWLTATQPNTILLMIGTNDTAWWTNEDGPEIAARHNALIDQLRTARPNARIYVASIAPQSSQMIHGKPDGQNQTTSVDRAVLTRDFNAALRTNVQARISAGQNVRFVDVNSVLTTADLYDGIHPTEAAHAKIAAKFLEAMRQP